MNSFFTARLAPLPLGLKRGADEKTGSADNSISDEVLLTRLQAGEKLALDSLFQRYSRIIRGIGARILRDSTEAEDLVQDVFLFIHQKCGIFDGSKSSARSWIVQMAYHRAIERRRRLAHRRFYSRVGLEDHAAALVGTPTTEVDYSAEAVFGRNGLHRVLTALSEHQRETLRLHFFEGYTLAEVGQELGQPLGNVRHHYYRALDKIRKQMFGDKVPADGNHAK